MNNMAEEVNTLTPLLKGTDSVDDAGDGKQAVADPESKSSDSTEGVLRVKESPAVLPVQTNAGVDVGAGQNGSKQKEEEEVKEDEEPSDMSKSVTFAEDVAIYSLGMGTTTKPLVTGESEEDITNSDLGSSDSKEIPAVLKVDKDGDQVCAPSLTPAIVPLRSATDEADSLSEDGDQRDDGDGQKHVFQVTRVDEPSPTAEEVSSVPSKPEPVEGKEPPKLGKVDSYRSESGHSSLSYNQDTIGPLDNPSFLRNLNYSVSQAAVNEAGEDDDDLNLNDFAGVKADVDGGWAWVILFASVCSLALTGASACSAGVFMPYILAQIEPDISVASWIGAVHISVSCFSGPTVSFWVERFGARCTAFAAGFVIVGGFVGSYFATSFLHLILFHGFLAGLGFGYILNVMSVVTGQYFNRYRGFACGLLATGSGAGILAAGSVLTFLLESFGLNGAYLLWAGICSHILVFAMLLRPSNEALLRSVEKKMSAEQIKMNHSHSGLNSLASGLNSVYSNGDVYSVFSGRTSDSRKLYRQISKRSSRGDFAANPLLRNVLNRDISDSRNSVNTNRSHRSHRSYRSAALSNGNLSLIQNSRLLDNTLLTADGQSLAVPSVEDRSSPLLSRASNYTISPLALPDSNAEQQTLSPDKSSPCPTTHIHSNFSLANETIPENEVVSRTNLEAPPSPTMSRSALSDFRKRLYSSASHRTSYSQISRLVSMRGPMRNGDLDNESLSSTLVSSLRPKDILEPRFRLGSRSIPTLFGSVASFPTALAIVKDDLSRIEDIGQPIEKTLQDHLIGLLDSLRLLRNLPFMMFTLACSLWAFGESPFFLYLPAYAISQGTDPSQAPSLYTALGFGSTLGRFLSGLVASDKMIGPLLIHIGCLGLAASVMILTPLIASSFLYQMLCAGFFGLYTGALVPLMSLITIEMLGISELGMGFGLLCMIMGLAYLTGPPLAGVLVRAMGFENCFFTLGIVMAAGSAVGMLIAVLLGHEVGGVEDDHGSLDDLERALRRVSNSMSSDSEDEENHLVPPDASSDISRPKSTSGAVKVETGNREDIAESGQASSSPKNEGWGHGHGHGDGLNNVWPEEQGELETIDEEVENSEMIKVSED